MNTKNIMNESEFAHYMMVMYCLIVSYMPHTMVLLLLLLTFCMSHLKVSHSTIRPIPDYSAH